MSVISINIGDVLMRKIKLTKIVASMLVAASAIALNPIGASAEWRQNDTGCWYTEGNSWATGWRNIDGKWYYFDSNGYMVKNTTIEGYTLGADGARIITSMTALTNGYTPQKYTINGQGSEIDYNIPEKYTINGKESEISDQHFQDIDKELGIKTKNLSDIQKIYLWKNSNFKSAAGGGVLIGKVTVNEIIEKKELTGCHDHALLMASILRKYGFPVVIVDATGIQWALDYPDKVDYFSGHVFIEVYVNNQWILIDSTGGSYVSNYDPSNRVIPINMGPESKGYYVMLKGLDPNDYGIYDSDQLNNLQIEYSNLLKRNYVNLKYPNYIIQKF